MSGFQLEPWLQARGDRVEALLVDRLRRVESAPRRPRARSRRLFPRRALRGRERVAEDRAGPLTAR